MGTFMINTLKSVCGKSGRRWDGEKNMIQGCGLFGASYVADQTKPQ